MQIKTTAAYHYIRIRIDKTDLAKSVEDVEEWTLLYIAGGNVRWYNHFG